MTWEETIRAIRKQPAFNDLVRLSSFDENLKLNVDRFVASDEWQATQQLIRQYNTGTLRVLDIGCGNGIAALAFALQKHDVVALDPDDSNTVGTGAVALLKEQFGLKNVDVITGYAETVDLAPASFDLVYCRQSMHHANDLNKFIFNCGTLLKQGGILLTVRDHVVFDEKDKQLFLDTHPLHKFYGGENAFSHDEYKNAFEQAGLEIRTCLKHFDSAINYYPVSSEQVYKWRHQEEENIKASLLKKLGLLGRLPLLYWLYTKLVLDPKDLTNEKKVPGRMYTYLSIKK